MFRSREIAKAAGVPAPALQESIIRFMLAQSLDFDPGTRYAYSNFGYFLLGRIIERLTNLKYDDFIREEVLSPAGIKGMRLGTTLEKGRAPGEVRYYTPKNRTGPCLFSEQAGEVLLPYGTFCLEAMDSHGGWIASAVDLARFAAAFDATNAKGCLKRETHSVLHEAPAPPVSRKADGLLEESCSSVGRAQFKT